MKKAFFIISAILVGALAGFGSAQYKISDAGTIGWIDNHGWRTNAMIGSTTADPYTRAVVARAGLLALNQEETIYYGRSRDDAGQAFDARCTYRVEGQRLPARWWSMTLYAEDNFLAVNGEQRHSVDATTIEADQSGAWVVRVAPEQADATNWISTKNAGVFALSIRLYNPGLEVREDMAGVALPRVVRERCQEGV